MLNEFDKKQGFYKLMNMESYIRRFSDACNTNSYFIAVFACCRELFKPDKMKDQIYNEETKVEAAEEEEEVLPGPVGKS